MDGHFGIQHLSGERFTKSIEALRLKFLIDYQPLFQVDIGTCLAVVMSLFVVLVQRRR
jgi:hypothetical protein